MPGPKIIFLSLRYSVCQFDRGIWDIGSYPQLWTWTAYNRMKQTKHDFHHNLFVLFPCCRLLSPSPICLHRHYNHAIRQSCHLIMQSWHLAIKPSFNNSVMSNDFIHLSVICSFSIVYQIYCQNSSLHLYKIFVSTNDHYWALRISKSSYDSFIFS